MFSKRRIERGLKPLGFFVAFECSTEILLVRRGKVDGLFEGVRCVAGKHRGGKWGDIAHANAELRLTPGQFPAMVETETITTWADTKQLAQARSWEHVVIESASDKIQALQATKGKELRARTAAARAASDRYMQLVNLSIPTGRLIEELKDKLSKEEKSEANRIASVPGIICLPERTSYDLASMLIAHHAGEVEGDPALLWGKDPYKEPELLLRIRILASRIYQEPGWGTVAEASPLP
jgi:hypothetical protein